MINSSRQDRFDSVCQAHYLSLARDCLQKGLNQSKIERSAGELSHLIDDKYYLKGIAYKPTGIALGYPLPDKGVTRQLWWLSRMVDRYLAILCRGEKPTFAFVPPDCYHVTIVNRSHFEFTAITPMTEDEKNVAEDVISQVGGPIALRINGLIITSSGGLIVSGFPCDDRICELRTRLVEALPQLRINVPIAAHIKLGHVLVHLNKDELKMFLDLVALCGEHISAQLIFHDAYTPAGRIVL